MFLELFAVYRFCRFGIEYEPSLAAEAVFDPATLVTQLDGMLLVLDAQEARKVSMRRCSVHGLEAVGANVLGTITNNLEKRKGCYYDGERISSVKPATKLKGLINGGLNTLGYEVSAGTASNERPGLGR